MPPAWPCPLAEGWKIHNTYRTGQERSGVVIVPRAGKPGKSPATRETSMKKVKDEDEMRSEYKREDLGVGVRGKYYEANKEGHNLVLLKPEVAEAFPSEEAVNEALLSLIKVAQASTVPTKGSSGRS